MMLNVSLASTSSDASMVKRNTGNRVSVLRKGAIANGGKRMDKTSPQNPRLLDMG